MVQNEDCMSVKRRQSCRSELLDYFLEVAVRASRLALAQPSFTICLARPSASEFAGTGSVMQEAAPTYEPLPNVTGATSVESLPTKTPSSIRVVCLFTPS